MMPLALAMLALAAAAVAILPPLHPVQIWTVVWALAVGAYSLRLLPYERLGTLSQLLIVCSSLAFVVGALAAERLAVSSARRLRARRSTAHRAEVPLAAALSLATTGVWLCAFVLQAVHSFGLHNALISSPAVRHAVQTGAFNLTVKYVYAALAAATLCGASAAIGPHRRRWAAGAAGAVLSTYFTTGRATIVVAAMAALCAYTLARSRLPSKRSLALGATAVAVLAVCVFTLGGSLIGKTFDDSELATIDTVFLRHGGLRPLALPYQYLSAPIAAFGVEVSLERHLPKVGGCATFSYVCSAAHHLGVSAEPLPPVRPFTARPLRWNTYTALDAPLLDGGPWLVVGAALLLGTVLGIIWAGARRGRIGSILCYAALAPAIATSAGANNFTAPLVIGAILIMVCVLRLSGAIQARTTTKREMACV